MSHTFHGPLRAAPENPRYFTERHRPGHLPLRFPHLGGLPGPGPAGRGAVPPVSCSILRTGSPFPNATASTSCGSGAGKRPTSGAAGASKLGQYLPSRYLEANPGRAPGELPKYDLDRLNPAYFERLRDRYTYIY